MRRRTMVSPATIVDSNLGDVILYDKKSNKLVSTSNFTALDEGRYIPIGIVVIPTAHDVYGTGECGVMALLSASTSKPDTGDTSNITMYWGGYNALGVGGNAGINYPELNDFNKFVRYGTMNNAQPLDFIDGESGGGYIPLQYAAMSVKLQCPHDPEANYYNSSSSSYGYLPSPYLADGSRNPDYYKTDSPATTANALSDFAGKANTEILCSKATSQSDWKTAQTIINAGDIGYHPVACTCWRFHTTGTTQGDWYLPACGELGYIAPRYELIISTIEAIQNWSSSPCCSVGAQQYWSSSEYDSDDACSVSFSNGLVRSRTRNFNAKPNRSTSCVRPFMRGRFFGIVS